MRFLWTNLERCISYKSSNVIKGVAFSTPFFIALFLNL